eukprot:338399_1
MIFQLLLQFAVLSKIINAQCSWIITDDNGIGRKLDLTNLMHADVTYSNATVSIQYTPCGNYAYDGKIMVYINPPPVPSSAGECQQNANQMNRFDANVFPTVDDTLNIYTFKYVSAVEYNPYTCRYDFTVNWKCNPAVEYFKLSTLTYYKYMNATGTKK